MKNLSNEDLEWLTRPDGHGDQERIVHIQNNFAIGTDGLRLHAINLDKIDEIEGVSIKEKVVDKFANSTAIENVLVNPQFLLDALKGMENCWGGVRLSISIASEDKIAIRIDSGNKTAIVMCMKDESNESY